MTAHDIPRDDLRGAAYVVTASAIVVVAMVDARLDDGAIDAAVDTLRRAADHAIAVHTGMRPPGRRGTP
jgi:hypothetical protein